MRSNNKQQSIFKRHENLLLATICIGGLLIFWAFLIYIYVDTNNEIDQLDCHELQQWVLNQEPNWDYAEHKFEWSGCEKEFVYT